MTELAVILSDPLACSLVSLQLRKAGKERLLALYSDAETLIGLFDRDGR